MKYIQAVGESVHDFLADLRRLAITCEFKDFLYQLLCDRFVCRFKAEGILEKPNLISILLKLWSLLGVLKQKPQRQRDSGTQAALQAPQAKSSILEKPLPPSSCWAKICQGPDHQVDLLVMVPAPAP